MKNNKLYNLMFPIWFLFVFPISWLVVMPVNFIIDTIVLIVGLKYLKVNKIYEIYKKIILKVWIFGFIANLVGAAVLLLTNLIPHATENSLYNAITTRVIWNPYISVWSIIILVIAMVVSTILIYWFNYKISFKKVGLDKKKAKKLAALIAIITAPWILLFPSNLLNNFIKGYNLNIIYNENNTNETKSSEIKNVLNELEGNAYIEAGVFDSKDLKVSVNCTNTNESEEYKKIFESDSTNETLKSNAKKIFNKISYVDDVIFEISNNKTYTFNRNEI